MTSGERERAPAGNGPGRARRRRIVRILLGLAVVVLAVAMFRTERRVQHDAALCTTSCHHQGEIFSGGTHASGHGDVVCQGCHTTTMGMGLTLLLQSYTKPDHPQKHGAVGAATCAACHEKRAGDWPLVAATAGHREHIGRKGVDCLSCHAKSTHRAAPPERACIACHEDQRLHKASTAGAETCLSCHTYAASSKRASPPTTAACKTCHAEASKLAARTSSAGGAPLKDVNEHALHGGVACQLCHNAHGKKAKPPDGQPACARCHQFENFQIGTEERKGPEGHRDCEGCHKPHAPRKTALTSCVTCHEKNAKGLTAVGTTGNTAALKHASCASCHLPHTWRAERSGCMQCHAEKAKLILTRSPPQHDACTKCHEVHGRPPTGAVCVTCHANTKSKHVALAPERHKDCTSCHDPHAPRPQDTRTSCAKCHATELTQVTRDGPEGHTKESCFGCHQPHENPLPPANICAKCHTERAKAVATAGPPKHRTCTSCHEKHKFTINDVATTCEKCHRQIFPARALGSAAQEKVPHEGECKGCHTLHGSPGVAKESCLKCHATVAAEFKPPNEKHAACRSCHEPHTSAKAAVAKCATCHDAKAATAAKWPAESAHAKACNGCHQQHDVRNKKVCADCHQQEVASAIGSKHECKQCHAPHTAPPGKGVAWWSRCNECHAAKVESVKLRGPVHAECKNCHQPHRFALPSCTTCHKDMASKGLHVVTKHAANCNACHDPHVKSEPTPAQCLACHTDRRNHEPSAQKCQACHQFR